jgi:glutamate 5-kinase
MRIVVKVGTTTLVDEQGRIKYPVINRLAQVLSQINQEHEVALVTSGAIGVAISQLQLTQRPTQTADLQALAAVGQSYLMAIYQQSFNFYQQVIGQVLLTYDDLATATRQGHLLQAVEAMFAQKIIPVVNENDTLAVDEVEALHSFGDNDQLSARLAQTIDADVLMLLSDVDALYDKNPKQFSDAVPIRVVREVTDMLRTGATGSASAFGTGGMTSKLQAAERMLITHKQAWLLDGADPELILQALAGQPVGTHFKGGDHV